MYEGFGTFGVKVPGEKRGRVMELMDTCTESQRKSFEEIVEQQNDPAKLDKQVEKALIQLMTNIKLSRDKDYTAAIKELDKLIGI